MDNSQYFGLRGMEGVNQLHGCRNNGSGQTCNVGGGLGDRWTIYTCR